MTENIEITTNETNIGKSKFTNDDLKEMQAMTLDQKIALSLTKIAEFNNKFALKTYISLSGGKDSTVLLHLVRKLYPNIPAVFIDTGLEFPEIKEFALSQPNVVRLRPKMSFRQVIETYGYPLVSKQEAAKIRKLRHSNISDKYRNYLLNGDERGKYGMLAKKWQFLVNIPEDISEKCCDVMKKAPAHQYEKETGRYPITGQMACESRLRKKIWLDYGCNIYEGNRIKSNPLSFWIEQDVLEYLVKFNVPYCSVYGEIKQDKNGKYYTTGEHRTGCIFCGFGCHLEDEPNRFQRLKETHPKLWEYCMKDWDDGGLGMKKVLDYINVKTE